MKKVVLGKVAKIDRTVATDDERKTLPYVGLEHIEKETGNFQPDYKPEALDMLATNFKFTSKHVLYGKLRPYLNKVALPNFDGVCTTEILPILPDEKQLDRVYLWSIFISTEFVAWATSQISGANLPRLDPKLLADYPLPVPPLPEQRRIAHLLSRADRLRRLRRVGDSLSASLLQSVFLEMFGDPVKNGKKLNVEKLGNIVGKEKFALVDGPFGSHLKADEYTDSGIRVIRVNNIKPNRFNFDDIRYVSKEKYQTIKRSTVRPKDVVMAKVGNTIGKTCVFPDEIEYAVLTANVCKISFDVKIANPFFMCYQMNFDGIQDQIRSLSGDTAKPMINLPSLRELKLIVPPLPEQQQFAVVVRRVESLRARAGESARQGESLFQSLLAQSFG